ncbi:SLAC1 anion channel family protein [Desulforamulus aeronauticus]|uniref:Tellurite resistance protein n=1 Tax=Desulforamulus aeronauticus DSM 10349 TaxID=1121421 RepID=A0A1M6QE42_9FIRM|nr:SLAC1 anion channel family protein [Desulforamulus aeronauticus]SHK18466.1 tellurite resistance protein [Desulforamulus aeronauticus DSM 10349]
MGHVVQFFPIGLFASVMGLCGLSIAYQRFEQVFGLHLGIGLVLLVIAYIVFAVVGAVYLTKLAKHTTEVVNEFNHPVKASFFPAISISLLLLSIGTLEVSHEVARYLWIAGAGLHFVFTIIIMSRWINRSYEIAHSNPAWFIPVVGNILVPIAGVEFAHIELMWFFFSVGLFFWLVLFTVIFYRIIFHNPLPPKLMPTLFILVAPPAMGFASYTKMTGEMDGFARVLLYVAIFFVFLLFSMARNFIGLNFFVSWWAYTFPMCAATIATTLAFKFTGLALLGWLAAIFIAVTTLIIAIVAVQTINAFRRKAVCVPD